jgi:hypothetical protein
LGVAFSREEEIDLVTRAIETVKNNPSKRLHIRGISTFEVIDLIRDYYHDCGYEDELAKNYTLPDDVRLTVSVSLSHILWCEKDKAFLNTRDVEGKQYGKMCLPVRSPADLRVLQQALRMNLNYGNRAPLARNSFSCTGPRETDLSTFHTQSDAVFQVGKVWVFLGLETKRP